MKLETLYELISFCSEKYNNAIGISDGELSKTYGEFFKDTIYAANKMLKMGLGKKHIAVCGPNSYGWLVSYFAASFVGAVLPLGDDATQMDIERLCEAAGSDIVISANYSGKIVDSKLNFIKCDELLVEHNDSPIPKPHTNNVAVLVPTSGTMGKERICKLTHKSLTSDIRAAVSTVDFHGNTVAVLPFHHSFGMLGGVFLPMYYGAKIAVCPAIYRMYGLVAQESPRYLFIVPAIADGIRNEAVKSIRKSISNGMSQHQSELEAYENIKKMLGGKCEFMIVGGAPTSKETEKFFAETSVALCQGYGLTECSPAVSVNPPDRIKAGSVGPAMRGITVSVLDPDENGCGELAISGDIIMAGYYNDPVSDAEVFSEHGLLTGDIGMIDEDGYIFITGRRKNLIILPNGKNVMPEELEEKLCALSSVEEAMVYDCGNVIGAKIYTLNESICKDEINDLNSSLPMYKRIANITFVNAPLPRNALKKLLRRKD